MASRLFVVATCLMCAVGYLAVGWRVEAVPLRASLATFPGRVGDWAVVEAVPLNERIRAELGVDEYINRVYANAERDLVGLYIGYYGSQRQGDSIHSPQNCLPGAGWRPVRFARHAIVLDTAAGRAGPSLFVNRYLVQKGLDRQLVFYWYQSQGRVIASDYSAKFYSVWDGIRRGRTDAALVRVVVPVSGAGAVEEAAAEARAVGFIGALFAHLRVYLPE